MTPKKRPAAAVLLAAGKGTRMKSELPKVVHPILGRPMIRYVTEACARAGADRIIAVVGYGAEKVKQALGNSAEYAEQKQQLGTGHALMSAAPLLQGFAGDLLVLVGDAPFLTPVVLKNLIQDHRKQEAAATLMTAVMDPPPPYGRIVRDGQGHIIRIVEDRDASPDEKKITEVNTSHYCFQAEKVFPLLKHLKPDNDQGEYYLTDIIQLLVAKGEKVETRIEKDPDVLMGINSREDLARATRVLQEKIHRHWMDSGVTISRPDQTVIESGVKIEGDTVIRPFTSLLGTTRVGTGCVIGPQVKLDNADIGSGCRIEFSVIENRKIGKNEQIGPFASMGFWEPENRK